MSNGEKGQIMMALIVLLVIPLLIITLTNLLTMENKWVVKHKKSTCALHLAEAAVDRGLWKLKESGDVWDSVADGTLSSDYKGQKEFTDLSGGTYKITISTTSDSDERKIIGIGRDNSANEVRTIQIIVYKDSVQAPIHAPVITAGGNAMVFWGPYMSRDSILLKGSNTNQLYPRKFARGAITVNGGKYPDRDTDEATPNTDDLEWWSYNESPGVPDLPELDFNEYKSKAQADGHYYTTEQNWSGYEETDSKTYYFEKDFKIAGNSFLRGNIICMADFTIQGNGTQELTVTPPSDAWKEYQKNCPLREDWNPEDCFGDTDAEDEYPGDGGLHTVKSVTIGDNNVDCANGQKDNAITVDGFIYVKSDFSAGGNACVYGVLMVGDNGTVGGGNFELYYNDNLEIETLVANFSQKSWKEILAQW